jgi:hypothetical protein
MFRNIEAIAAKVKGPIERSMDCPPQSRKIAPQALAAWARR